MKGVYLIVEGQAEEKYYKSTFAEAFATTNFFEVSVMPAKRNLTQRINKGGYILYSECVHNIRRYLRQSSHCSLVILVYDYYGIHESFKDHLTQEDRNLEQKVQKIRSRLEEEIDDPRFKFFLQVHEFESYLFTDPDKIVEHYDEPAKAASLNAILDSFNGEPEKINDSRETAPSKRIISLFPRYEFGKTTDGVSIASKIGVPAIRAKCPYFNSFCELIEE